MTLQAEIRSPNDNGLDFINEFSQMAHNTAGSEINCIKQLSKYSATSIHYTCNWIVSLCQHVLATNHKYVSCHLFYKCPTVY